MDPQCAVESVVAACSVHCGAAGWRRGAAAFAFTKRSGHSICWPFHRHQGVGSRHCAVSGGWGPTYSIGAQIREHNRQEYALKDAICRKPADVRCLKQALRLRCRQSFPAWSEWFCSTIPLRQASSSAPRWSWRRPMSTICPIGWQTPAVRQSTPAVRQLPFTQMPLLSATTTPHVRQAYLETPWKSRRPHQSLRMEASQTGTNCVANQKYH